MLAGSTWQFGGYLVFVILPRQSVQEVSLAPQSKNDKTFIALQLPTKRPIPENAANQIFDILEQGSEFLSSWSLAAAAVVAVGSS